MKRNVIIYAALTGFLLIALIATAVVGYLAITGASSVSTTNFVTYTPEDSEETNSENMHTDTPEETEIVINTPIPIETATPEVSDTENTSTPTEEASSMSCNRSDSQDFVLFVYDNNTGEIPFGLESIKIVQFDYELNSASVFSLSRYLHLTSAYLNENYGITSALLGDMFQFILQREGLSEDPYAVAAEGVLQTINEHFALEIESYIVLDYENLAAISDLNSGISIEIDEALITENNSFNVGYSILSGTQLVDYFDYLPSISSETSRIIRQNDVLVAMLEAFTDETQIYSLDDIQAQFGDLITTNLSDEEQIDMLCISHQLSDNINHILFSEIHTDNINTMNDQYLSILDYEAAADQINEFLGY